ncbi:hypothetical protein [Methylobacterium sp. NEAU K]|uniref:hypothetical protein n=1 Tax=Methylobacterium sp. NEAU K TaxID=3064946 RepID=UPI002736A24A|nr:hypothetical protein [Methylobacterium sp. NEAU K]MDP4003936.1 hypothetical protein [Methylobacterium sp. NEAU K]
MTRRLELIGRVSAACILAALTLLAAAPAQARSAAACPHPKKLAAGACVTTCPAGYEDRGRDCVYRNQSR